MTGFEIFLIVLGILLGLLLSVTVMWLGMRAADREAVRRFGKDNR